MLTHYYPCYFSGNDSNDERDEKETDINDENSGCTQYVAVCKSLGIVPIRRISEQLREHEMSLQHLGMNSTDSKALACALWVNHFNK